MKTEASRRRTEDSLIVSISVSDPLTAESWLFSLNFPQEYACDFSNKNRRIRAPSR